MCFSCLRCKTRVRQHDHYVLSRAAIWFVCLFVCFFVSLFLLLHVLEETGRIGMAVLNARSKSVNTNVKAWAIWGIRHHASSQAQQFK